MADITFSPRRRFWWPVRVRRAEDGEWVTYEFKARFEMPEPHELQDAARGAIKADEFLRTHVVDWEGPKDESGQAVAFSAEVLDQALRDLDARRGLLDALMEASNGEAERKN